MTRHKAARARESASVARTVCTLFPGEGDDISGALAHHLGDVEGAVGLIGYGDGTVDCLGLHLPKHRLISSVNGPTERTLPRRAPSVTSSGRLSACPSGPVIPSSRMRLCS